MRVCSNQSTNNMGLRQKLDFQQLRIQSTRTIRLGTHLNCLAMMPIKTSCFILGFPVSHVWLPEGPLRVSTTKCGHMNMKTSNWMRDSVSSGGEINLVTTSSHSWEAYYHIYGSSMDHLTWSSSISIFFPKRCIQNAMRQELPHSFLVTFIELCLNPKFLLGANPISGEWNPKFGWNPKVLLAKITWKSSKVWTLGTPSAAPGLKGLTWLEPSMALVQARNSSDCTSSWPFDFQLFHFSHLAFLKNLSEPQKTHPSPQLVIYVAVIRLLLSMTANWVTGCCCTTHAVASLSMNSMLAQRGRIQCCSADGEMPRMLAGKKRPNVCDIQ